MRVKGNVVRLKCVDGEAFSIPLKYLQSLRVCKKEGEPSYKTLHIVQYEDWNGIWLYDDTFPEDGELVITKREYEKLKDYLEHNEQVENLGSETEITEETCYRLIEEDDDII